MDDAYTPKLIHHTPDKKGNMDEKIYRLVYKESIADPKGFWGEQAQRLITWVQPWEEVREGDFQSANIKWFVNGKLNACFNCLDRHLPHRAEQVALIWEGSNASESQTYTYQALYEEVCRFANVLRDQGIKKGDVVGVYLPMIPQLVIAMLACARIGAIHSIIFSGFSADALSMRLQDTRAKLLITSDESIRGNKSIPIKQNSDQALKSCPLVQSVIVVRRTGGKIALEKRDAWYHDLMSAVDSDCPCVEMDASDPLFILYTSGSTGKPKGIVHATGGYLVYTAYTYQVVFDHRDGDVLFCTADPGWITGHSYLVYGPLANGATTILFEGIPNYPTYARYWEIIAKYHVTTFYTSPTALRAIRAAGDEWITADRSSLRILGSVGEPIGPDVWYWYYCVVGEQRCPIVNTWWQTETGGILITALPGDTQWIPGSAGSPFFGIEVDIVDEEGKPVQNDQPGRLVIKQPWPGLMQSIFGDHQRFVDAYLSPIPGAYLSGDEAYRDEHGSLFISGRNDDVIKVSGHRLGSEELESALVSYQGVAEAAVVGMPHSTKGECVVAFVTLMPSLKPSDDLQQALKRQVRDKIGAIATPEYIFWAAGLPKTRSGKIMRRILRNIAKQDFDNMGDISTLIDPDVVEQLVAQRKGLLSLIG